MKANYIKSIIQIAKMLFVFTTTLGSLIAQDPVCPGEVFTSALSNPIGVDYETDYVSAVTNSTIDNSTIYQIPVVVHNYHNNGSGSLTDLQITSLISGLNKAYANVFGSGNPSKITFKLVKRTPDGSCTNGIHRVNIPNPDLDGSDFGYRWTDAYNWDTKRYLNIHIVREFINVGNIIGWGGGVPIHDDRIDGEIAIPSNYITNPNLLAHEVGHWLQLNHYQTSGGCSETGSNCLTNYDKVCDTYPAGGTVSYGSGCQVTVCGNTFDLDNYMWLGLNPCLTTFTDGQIARARFTLQWAGQYLTSLENRKCLGLEGTFGFAMNPQNEFEITGSYAFSGGGANPVILDGSIRVKSGAILTIASGVEIKFCKDAKLIIEPNAKVFLLGTLSNSCSEPWDGVEVIGATNSDQQTYNSHIILGPLGYKQGYIRCYPGSVIENAKIGIKLYANSTNQVGGITYCDGLTIKNCQIGIDTKNYGLNNSKPYNATILSTNFITDDDFPFTDEKFVNIQMEKVRGIRMVSCHFINTKNRVVSPILDDFGIGILCSDGSFDIYRDCFGTTESCTPGRLNKFSGLAYGIIITKIEGNLASSIKSCEFYDNYVGIHTRYTNLQQILFNKFYLGNLSHPSLVDHQIGTIFEDVTVRNVFEENSFTQISGNKSETIGTILHAIGIYANSFRRNTYSGLSIGTLTNGICGDDYQSGAKFICNTNSDNTLNDYLVPTSLDKVCTFQSFVDFASSTLTNYAAKNTFSHVGGTYSDWENHNGFTIQYYRAITTAETPATKLNVTNIIGTTDNRACSVKYCERPCAVLSEGTTFHNGTSESSLKSAFNTIRASYNSAKIANPSLPTEVHSYFRRKLHESATDLLIYMSYDTVTVKVDSINSWLTKADNVLNYASTSFKVIDYKTIIPMPAPGSPISDLTKEQIIKLEQLVDLKEVNTISSIAKNILAAKGTIYPPIYHVNTDELLDSDFSKNINNFIQVHPNPSSGLVTLTLDESLLKGKATIKIYDISGKVVFSKSIENANKLISLDLSHLGSGVFYVECNNDGETLGKKLILTK